MNYTEKLISYPRATISENDMQKLINETNYDVFCNLVVNLINDGILAPVKAAGLNGRLPPLANKYHIIKPQHDYTEHLTSIRHLHPRLNISAYLKQPHIFHKHQEIVEGLSRYLWYSEKLLEVPMSRRERSFSIWSREKMIDKNEKEGLLREVLKFNLLDESFLNYYDTPEPFFEYIHSRPEHITVLIIENKDSWFTFRKLMQDTGMCNVADIPVNVLLYGEGNKISKTGALEQYCKEILGGQHEQATRFLYFGDLDGEGIRLFFRAREANPTIDLRPFSTLYRLMLKLARDLDLPQSLDKRGIITPLDEFCTLLDLNQPNEEGQLKTILAEGRYIPQEIINYHVVAKILS